MESNHHVQVKHLIEEKGYTSSDSDYIPQGVLELAEKKSFAYSSGPSRNLPFFLSLYKGIAGCIAIKNVRDVDQILEIVSRLEIHVDVFLTWH